MLNNFKVCFFFVFVFFNAEEEIKIHVQSEDGKATIQDCGWETYWGKKVEIHTYLHNTKEPQEWPSFINQTNGRKLRVTISNLDVSGRYDQISLQA